jgi:hypothetical protein
VKKPGITTTILVIATMFAAAADAAIRRNPNAIKNEYIVVLEDSVSGGQVDGLATALAHQHGGIVRTTWQYAVKGFLVLMNEEQAEAWSHNPKVALVEENATLPWSASQDTNVDPATGASTGTEPRLWHLDRLDQTNATLDNKYSYCTTGNGVTVYVVDFGVIGQHSEFLPNQVKVGVDTSGDDPAYFPANDPCHGWPAAEPVITDTNDPAYRDYQSYWQAVVSEGHGTSVASLVAGQKVGVAKNASIVPIKIARCDTLSARRWRAGHAYHVNDLIFVADNGARYWKCTSIAGTGISGSTRPVFLATEETYVDNGQVTWTQVGPQPTPLWQASHAYKVGDVIFVVSASRYWQVSGISGGGLSGTTRPAFPAGDATASDNQVTWTNVGGSVSTGEANINNLISGLNWILDSSRNPNPVDHSIATFSTFQVLGNPDLGSLDIAVKNLTSHGVTVIASANNQGDDACNTSPGRLSRGNPTTALRDKVITAGGTMPVTVGGVSKDARWIIPNPNDDASPFSSFTAPYDPTNVFARDQYAHATMGSNAGACVTLFAPAKRITSARMSAANEYRDRNGFPGDTPIPAYASGTSWSAPLTAGIAARFLETRSSATLDEVYNALMNSATRGIIEDSTTYPLNTAVTGTPNVFLRGTDAWIYDEWPKQVTINAGQSTTLSVSASGSGTLTYQWYQGLPSDTSAPVASAPSIAVTPSSTTSYWVRVSTSCSNGVGVDSLAATVTVNNLAAPTNVSANASGATVTITWTPSSGADGYNIERKVSSANWAPAGSVNGGSVSSTTDTPTAPTGVVLYRVIARAGNATSQPSNNDVAWVGSFSDDPIAVTAPYTTIKAAHITEVRRAVNGLLDIGGQGAMYTAGELDPNSLRNQFVDEAHFTTLMQNLNLARSYVTLPSTGFRSPPTQNSPIVRTQMEDLRLGLK